MPLALGMPEGFSTGLRVQLIGQAVTATCLPRELAAAASGSEMQFDDRGRWRGKVQDRQYAPRCSLLPYNSIICLSLCRFSLESAFQQPTLSWLVIIFWVVSFIYLSSLYWEARTNLTSWISPGVRGLFRWIGHGLPSPLFPSGI